MAKNFSGPCRRSLDEETKRISAAFRHWIHSRSWIPQHE
jgi:hypothetical protein